MLKEAEEQKAAIERSGDLVFTRKAGEDGKLFGSVTSADIEEALGARGFKIDRRKIILDRPVKHLGDTQVTIKIHAKVSAAVKVMVQPEAEPEQPAAQTEEGEAAAATKAAPLE
jgi:large subunit ribosomal protein L9